MLHLKGILHFCGILICGKLHNNIGLPFTPNSKKLKPQSNSVYYLPIFRSIQINRRKTKLFKNQVVSTLIYMVHSRQMEAIRTLYQPYNLLLIWQNINPTTPDFPSFWYIMIVNRPRCILTRTDLPTQEDHNIMGGQSQIRPDHKGIIMTLFSDNDQQINEAPPSGYNCVQISMLQRWILRPECLPTSLRTPLQI